MSEGGELSAAQKSQNETIAGMVAGFVCKLIEYPLDTVKVQVQTQTPGPNALSPLQMLTRSIKSDGFMGLYRGIPSPLIGSMMENSVLFASYGFASRLVHTGDAEEMPFSKKLVAGGFSGFCVAAVLTPVELIKCKMQTSNETAVRYKSTTECLLATLREGGPRAIYHGHVGTLCREVPGNMAWFGGYELGLYMQIPKGGSRSDVNPLGLMAAGACGGSLYWLLPFPFDVVKSKIQTGTHGIPKGSPVNVLSVLKHVGSTEGIKGLYRGCGITVARAAPSNAALFCVYEMTMRALAGQPIFGGN